MNFVIPNNLRSTTLGCKDIRIRNSEFVAKTNCLLDFNVIFFKEEDPLQNPRPPEPLEYRGNCRVRILIFFFFNKSFNKSLIVIYHELPALPAD